jgi:hypothetical protein
VEPPNHCSTYEARDDELTRQVRVELRMRCGRQRGRVIDGLHVHVAGARACLSVPHTSIWISCSAS